MKSKTELKIEVPLILLKNLISCIEFQKTLLNSNMDLSSRLQMQSLIDDTKEWTLNLIDSKTENLISIQETLDFIEMEKNKTQQSEDVIVEPNDLEKGFYNDL